MTCISAVIDKKNKCIVMGGDSASTTGTQLTTLKEPKVIYQGGLLFGGCGNPMIRQGLISDPFTWEDYTPLLDDVNHYIVHVLIPKLKIINETSLEHSENKYWKLLVGIKDRLFVIYNNFYVEERANPYNAIGDSSDFAKGVLWRSYSNPKGNVNTEETVYDSIFCACTNSTNTSTPIDILKMDFDGNLIE